MTSTPVLSYPGIPLPVNPHKLATTQLADAIAHVESDFGTRMSTGDGSRNGWHMFGEKAWKDVSAARKSQGHVTYYYRDAFDYRISTLYCIEYLKLLEGRLRECLGRDPTIEEVLSAYRCGFNHFKRLGFQASYYHRYCNAVKKHIK